MNRVTCSSIQYKYSAAVVAHGERRRVNNAPTILQDYGIRHHVRQYLLKRNEFLQPFIQHLVYSFSLWGAALLA